MISDHEMNDMFAERIAAAALKREQMRVVRAEFAEARRHGKAKYHASRLRAAAAKPTTTKESE